MISADDIAAFEADSQPAFTAGKAFVRRKRKGLPPDRWATTNSMPLVADCISYQWVLIEWLVQELQDAHAELIRRGDESMGVYDRNGNRTS